MRRIATTGRRAAALVVIMVVPLLGACESRLAAPALERPRIFQVALADGQLLPATRDCPAPAQGMEAGARFVEGELILYPERTFTWRYTVEQYASVGGSEQEWVEPATVQGTYVLSEGVLDLVNAEGATRRGRLSGDVLELPETVVCRFATDSDPDRRIELDLTLTGHEG